MKNILLSTLLLFLMCSCQIKKEPTYFKEFFTFKINGQKKSIGGGSISGGSLFYCSIQGDTSLLITVGTGESIVITVKDSKISDGTYLLDDKNYGGYSIYSPAGILKYRTTNNFKGSLTIKRSTYLLPAGTKKALDGSFSFTAYDSLNNKSIEITEGSFSMGREEF